MSRIVIVDETPRRFARSMHGPDGCFSQDSEYSDAVQIYRPSRVEKWLDRLGFIGAPLLVLAVTAWAWAKATGRL